MAAGVDVFQLRAKESSDTEILAAAQHARSLCERAGALFILNDRADLASDKDVAEVEQEATSAKEAGIQGVPMFIFDGRFAVSGAQAPEYLAEAIERASRNEGAAAAE